MFAHHGFFADGDPHMHFYFLLVDLGVVGLEVVPHPIYVLSFLTDYHPLHVLILHQDAKLDVIYSIAFRGDGFALYEEIVRDMVVGSMEKCLFE